MNLMLGKWIGLIAAFLFLNTGFVQASATPIICDQEYALCTSARCIPTSGNPANAVCDCIVEKVKVPVIKHVKRESLLETDTK